MKRHLFTLLILMFTSLLTLAQVSHTQGYAPSLPDKRSTDEDGGFVTENNPGAEWDYESTSDRLDVNVSIGASFGTTVYGGSAFSNYLASEFSYRLTPRLRMSTGIMVGTTFGQPYGSYRPSYPVGGLSSTTLYVEGAYLLRPNLEVSGMAYKRFPINQPAEQQWAYPGTDGQGMSFRVNYSPSSKFHISGSFTIMQGRGTGYRSPYYSPYQSPFHNPATPFNPYPGHW